MKYKHPSFLRRILTRFCGESFKDWLIISQQELRLKRMLATCKHISADDFCNILAYKGLIQDRTGGRFFRPSFSPALNSLVNEFEDNVIATKIGRSKVYKRIMSQIMVEDSSHLKVVVKDLVIYAHSEDNEYDLSKVIGLDIEEDEEFQVIDIEFINCIIVASLGRSDTVSNQSFPWTFEKFEHSKISFNHCILWRISVSVYQMSGPPYSTDDTCVEFNDTFSISASGGFEVFSKIDRRRYDVEKLDPPDETCMSLGRVVINNCQFQTAFIYSANLSLKGKNIIEKFECFVPPVRFVYGKQGAVREELDERKEQIKYGVHWGPYQIVSPNASNWEGHKAWLLKLKAIAEEEQDKSQRDTFDREIMKCDRELIRQEPWLTSWQDRLTLWFNATFSNYGISWVRPLMLLFAVNALYSLLTACLSPEGWSGWDFLHTFLECFNPLSIPESGSEKAGISALLLGAGLVQKLFFVVCVYEIIRAGRRFSRS